MGPSWVSVKWWGPGFSAVGLWPAQGRVRLVRLGLAAAAHSSPIFCGGFLLYTSPSLSVRWCVNPRGLRQGPPPSASSTCCCKNVRDECKQVTVAGWLRAARFLFGNTKCPCSYLCLLDF